MINDLRENSEKQINEVRKSIQNLENNIDEKSARK